MIIVLFLFYFFFTVTVIFRNGEGKKWLPKKGDSRLHNNTVNIFSSPPRWSRSFYSIWKIKWEWKHLVPRHFYSSTNLKTLIIDGISWLFPCQAEILSCVRTPPPPIYSTILLFSFYDSRISLMGGRELERERETSCWERCVCVCVC